MFPPAKNCILLHREWEQSRKDIMGLKQLVYWVWVGSPAGPIYHASSDLALSHTHTQAHSHIHTHTHTYTNTHIPDTHTHRERESAALHCNVSWWSREHELRQNATEVKEKSLFVFVLVFFWKIQRWRTTYLKELERSEVTVRSKLLLYHCVHV